MVDQLTTTPPQSPLTSLLSPPRLSSSVQLPLTANKPIRTLRNYIATPQEGNAT